MASLTDDVEDIVVEIMARLPVKSLMRFRCVSKPWCALISQPHFVKKHRRFADRSITKSSSSRLIFLTNPPTFIRLEDLKSSSRYGPVAPRKLELPETTRDFEVWHMNYPVGSCNGLICLEFNHSCIMLWNPCTQESEIYLKPRKDCISRFYGFGYDSAMDDYKVILVGSTLIKCEHGSAYTLANDTTVQLFSLKSGIWKIYEEECELTNGLKGQGCCSNGALYWLDFKFSVPRGGSKIVSFDLSEEQFEEVPLPLDYDVKGLWGGFHGFITSQNRLCLYSGAYSPSPLKIHMLKDDKESWTEVMKLDSDVVPGWCNTIPYLALLCILEDGEILMQRVELGAKLALYNPEEKTFRDLAVGRIHLDFDSIICSETLVSPVLGSDAEFDDSQTLSDSEIYSDPEGDDEAEEGQGGE